MNPKSKLWVIHKDQTILMNATFAKMETNTFSDEYAHLQRVREQNPGYKLKVRQIKRKANKLTYKGLTYERMREYIIRYTEDAKRTKLLADFDHLLDISYCQAKARRYPVIKKWFFEQFPEVKNFALADEESANAETDFQEPLQLTA